MIRLLILDVDGVLTDGGLHYGPDGEWTKRFDVRDGLGIKLLMAEGVTVAIVSGRDSAALRCRARELGIVHVHAGVGDKAAAAVVLQRELGVTRDETAVMGDDLPDLAMFGQAGLTLAPADAEPEVIAVAQHVTARTGGHGAVRDAARYILARNGIGPSGRDAHPALHG